MKKFVLLTGLLFITTLIIGITIMGSIITPSTEMTWGVAPDYYYNSVIEVMTIPSLILLGVWIGVAVCWILFGYEKCDQNDVDVKQEVKEK
jgi:uncharacterized membrane protein